MNERVRQLIPAIVSYVNQHGSYVSKTKLLKLLYLFDIEWYREHRETYTGFDWIFLHLGPWSNEYDPLIEELKANLVVTSTRSSNANFDTEFFRTPKSVDFSSLFDSYKDEIPFRIAVATWAEKSTAEILDYVYFWTEPMDTAERYNHLDFSSVAKEREPEYRPIVSKSTRQEIEAARARIAEAAKRLSNAEERTSPQSRYDSDYFEAMDNLDSMP
jgi:hypothetical protein